MVTKTLIIIPKKREKEMISRMKFWCVRLRERGEMFTEMMENVVVNDHIGRSENIASFFNALFK